MNSALQKQDSTVVRLVLDELESFEITTIRKKNEVSKKTLATQTYVLAGFCLASVFVYHQVKNMYEEQLPFKFFNSKDIYSGIQSSSGGTEKEKLRVYGKSKRETLANYIRPLLKGEFPINLTKYEDFVHDLALLLNYLQKNKQVLNRSFQLTNGRRSHNSLSQIQFIGDPTKLQELANSLKQNNYQIEEAEVEMGEVKEMEIKSEQGASNFGYVLATAEGVAFDVIEELLNPNVDAGAIEEILQETCGDSFFITRLFVVNLLDEHCNEHSLIIVCRPTNIVLIQIIFDEEEIQSLCLDYGNHSELISIVEGFLNNMGSKPAENVDYDCICNFVNYYLSKQ